MSIEVFVSDRHSGTNLSAVVSTEPDDEAPHSIYLYLSGNDGIVGDCFLSNLVVPEDQMAIPAGRDAPPAVVKKFLRNHEPSEAPDESCIEIRWSQDGKSVLAIFDTQPMGFVLSGEKTGYSKALSEDCPWGKPWSEKLFQETFKGNT